MKKDISTHLPLIVYKHGATLSLEEDERRFKYTIENCSKGIPPLKHYRKFIYVNKTHIESTYSLNDLITAYIADFNLNSLAKDKKDK